MICDRCGKQTNVYRGSFFNEDKCCMDCILKESRHPLYPYAKEKEREAVLAGNYNFCGIGLPDDLAGDKQK